MTTAADLRAAADVIRRDGFIKHHYIDEAGRDINGALAYVISDGRTSLPMQLDMTTDFQRWHQADVFLRLVIGVASIDGWGDHPSREACEVVAALEAAAELADGVAAA